MKIQNCSPLKIEEYQSEVLYYLWSQKHVAYDNIWSKLKNYKHHELSWRHV